MTGYVAYMRYMENADIAFVGKIKEGDHLRERGIKDNWLLKPILQLRVNV